MPRPWRLLPLRAGRAAEHMATDEAVFRAYAEGLVPPTLRFYTWEPPGVSCGRFQDIAREVDLDACRARGFDVVRRPTGGRALLHQGDLTYAVITGGKDGLPAGILPAYLHLSRGLLAGLARLGLAADLYTPTEKTNPRSPACFASPSWYELTVGGRKVAGSAQKREGPVVLQHGAVMLSFSPARQAAVLRTPLPRAVLTRALAGSAAGLCDYQPGLTVSGAVEALTAGFAEALGITFVAGSLTPAEESLVRQLMPGYMSSSTVEGDRGCTASSLGAVSARGVGAGRAESAFARRQEDSNRSGIINTTEKSGRGR